MTDRFITVPDSLELPAAVKVPVARLVGPTGAAATPADLGAATAAQGELADTAVQPGCGPGTTDDTARLQALLTAGGTVRGKPGETYTITGTLIIGSDTTLDMTGCTVQWKAGVSGDNLLTNSTVTPQRSITDAATTAGSTTLTSATAAFTSADVGRTLCVTGAGGAVGAATVLTCDIASVTDATTVELSDPARNTVADAAARIHDRDQNIAVIGGIWDRGAAVGNSGLKLHGLSFRHVDTLTIDIDSYLSTAVGAKYAILLGSVKDARVSVRRLDTISDGVHINGPARKIEIPYLAGRTRDDMVSLTGADYPHYSDTAGDITDITVGTLHADGCLAGYKILAGQGNVIDRFRGGHFAGTCDSYAAWVGADENYSDTMGGSYGNIDLGVIGVESGGAIIRIIDADAALIRATPTGTSATQVAVYVGQGTGGVGASVDMLVINDVAWVTGDLVRMTGTNSLITQLHIERLSLAGNGLVVNASSGTVGHLLVKDSAITYTGAAAPFYSTGGQVSALTLIDVDVITTSSTGVGAVVQKATGIGFPLITITRGSVTGANSTRGLVCYNPSTSATTLVLDNCNLVDLKRVADGVSAGLTVIMSNPRIKSALECFHTSAGGATIVGSLGQLTTATNLFSATSAGTLRVNGANLPAKVGALTGVAGDVVKNTDATLGCGAGVVISNGTLWKHLYTGATTSP